MKILMVSVFAVSTALLTSTAFAQSKPQQQSQATTTATAVNDPVICEKQEVTGSRLASRKVCMKRSQWQDTQLQERQTLEKAQVQRGYPGG